MQFDFDVALSYAGEDRQYVGRVALELRESGVRLFYDEFERVALWGADLIAYLDDVYRNKSRFVVVFASKHYAAKMWTSHERRSAQARALLDKEIYLLPVRLDDTDVPGLQPTIAYLDGRSYKPEEVARFIGEKLSQSTADGPSSITAASQFLGVPLTADDYQTVVLTRPDGWEYLLLAGGIWREVQNLEQELRDNELGFAAQNGSHLSEDDIKDFISISIDRLSNLTDKIATMLRPATVEWAVGTPGTAGDPVRIAHLSRRFGSMYEEFLNWASNVRGTACPSEYRRLLTLLSHFADEPVREIRQFAEEFVAKAGLIPAHFSGHSTGGDQLELTIELTLNMDNRLMQEFGAERKRLRV